METKINTPMNSEDFNRHQSEVRLAVATFPGIEIGEAYRKWKIARGEKPELEFAKSPPGGPAVTGDMIMKLKDRPCTRPGCVGIQTLESVCAGCIEGQAGYKTKWTCRTCLHRDLSKEDFMTCIQQLSLSLKPSS